MENIKTLQEIVDSLTEQKLTYITEIDGAENKIKSLSTACKNYEESLNKQKADIIIKENKLAELSCQLSNVDSEIISLKRQNGRLLEENEQLLNQLTEMEARIVEFNNLGLQQQEQLQLLEEKVHVGK